MFILTVDAHFDSAHCLPAYPGPCRRIHGHRWVVRAEYQFARLDDQGMCYDLLLLKKTLYNIVSTLDHQLLNDILDCIPTAENIARIIFYRLYALNDQVHAKFLTSVSVYETPDTCVTYASDHVISSLTAKVLRILTEKEKEKGVEDVNAATQS